MTTTTGPDNSGPTYTCCTTADIEKAYQPGQTVEVHWIVVPAKGGGAAGPVSVELNAKLEGPFSTVGELKGSAGGGTVAAEPVRPTGAPGEQPVSRIPLPPDAAPGYYDLVTSITQPGGTVSGASVIRVVAGT